MRALNKQTGQLEKVYVKALDSMPVGTIVEFNGQASDIPSGWEEVNNVLWTNPNPTNSFAEQTINLDMSDYNYIEIYYRFYTGATGEQIATKIPVGSSAKFINEVWLEGIGETIAMRTIHTSSFNIVFTNASVVALSDGTLRTTDLANGTMIPTKVVGYK